MEYRGSYSQKQCQLVRLINWGLANIVCSHQPSANLGSLEFRVAEFLLASLLKAIGSAIYISAL
jgi:hypothetical protein